MSSATDQSAYVQLGKVVGVWGVRGWVKLHSYTRNRIDIGAYSNWLLKAQRGDQQFIKYELLNCRAQGQGIVAQLGSVNDRDQAQILIGHDIYVPTTELPKLSGNEYYWQQLIGLSVFDTDSTLIGVVDSILETGANDVLVINKAADISTDNVSIDNESAVEKSAEENRTKQILIPYTPQVVLDIDLQQGSMTVDWDLAYLE